MTHLRLVAFACFVTALLSASARSAPEVAPFPTPAGYKTVTTAKALMDAPAAAVTFNAAGYLGVVVGDKKGRVVVEAVAPDSPAEQAGLKEGDVVLKFGGEAVTATALKDALRSKLAGESVAFTVSRGDKTETLTAKLKATTVQMSAEERVGGGKGGFGWDDRLPRSWRKPTIPLHAQKRS